jgi:hypothetical protein
MCAPNRPPRMYEGPKAGTPACCLMLLFLVPAAVLLGGCGAPAATPTPSAVAAVTTAPTVTPVAAGVLVPSATAVPTVAATPTPRVVPSPLVSPAADACGAATLARFKQIVNRPSTDVPLYLVTERLMAEVPSLLGTDFSNVIWIIAARGTTTCVVTMTALTGGAQIKGPAFAIDVNTGLVTADNYDARTVFATGPYTNVRLP